MIRTKQKPKPTQIRIIKCNAKAPEFKNCLPGTVHDIVPCPVYISPALATYGVWIMGATNFPSQSISNRI